MKKILILFLAGISFMAAAETRPSAEKLITSGDPAQVAIGYLHCGTVMLLLGNAAIRSNPEEGAGYIASGQQYGKLYRNATDLRTEEKKSASVAQATKLMQTYGEMAKSETLRPFLLTDFKFCMKWIKDI